MGCTASVSRIHFALPEDPTVVRTLRKVDPNMTAQATFNMVLFDVNTKVAFVKFLEARSYDYALQLYERIKIYKEDLTAGKKTQSELDEELRTLVEMSFWRNIPLNESLRRDIGSLLISDIQFIRELALVKLSEAQSDISHTLQNLLPKFERSKEFASYVQYYSTHSESCKMIVKTTSNPNLLADVNPNVFIARMKNSFKAKKILIVENSTLVAKIIICSLQSRYFNVLHATNPSEALLSLLTTEEYDVVLFSLDISADGGMHIYAGYKYYRQKVKLGLAKFIGMANEATSPHIPLAMKNGFHSILVKPFRLKDMLAAIRI